MGVDDLIKVFSSNSNYAKFVEFVKQREKGLRKPSLSTLSKFIREFKDRPFLERKAFVALFCETSLKMGDDFYLFSPHPLLQEIVLPTTIEWTQVEPNCALGYRWAGKHALDWQKKEEFFRKALDLDLSDDYSRSKLINIILGDPEHSVHHLNESIYLGNPKEDLTSLEEAKVQIKQLTNHKSVEYWTKEVNELESMILDWMEYSKEERTMSFPQFTRNKGNNYGWSEAYYYDK